MSTQKLAHTHVHVSIAYDSQKMVNNPNVPQVMNGKQNVVYIHKMNYYLAIKRNEVLITR